MSRIRKRRLVQSKSSVTVKTDNEIILLPKQKEFIFLEDRFTALSGGFGSAKTFAGCMKGIILSALFPGNSGLVSRMTYPELRDSTRKTFLELVPTSWILSWNESFNTLILKNGSQVIFRPIDDIRKQRSLNLGWFYIDQAEECTREDFHDLAGRLRHPVPKQFGFCTVNPDGHNWVWQDFFDKPRRQYKGLNSTTFDNPYLPPGYIQSLIDAYPKEWVERFVYGSHEVRSGVILSEYNDDLQVDPFIIPANWIKGRGMDWGVDKPCTRVSVALSPEGIFYVFDCYGQSGLTPEEHSANILERDRGIAYQLTKMDSTAWSKHGMSKDAEKLSPAIQFIKAGIKMSPATRDFMGSLVNYKSLMKRGLIKFFRGQCDPLIEEQKNWKWGKLVAGKEKPAVGDDHYIDSCFIAKTSIFTDKGYRPISEIKIGEKVWTRNGFKKVIASGMTNKNAEVKKYTFSNGVTLTATKNHPVLTTKGFKPIGVLTQKDIVCIMDMEATLCKKNQSYTTELNTEDTQAAKIKIRQPISDPRHGKQEDVSTFIEKFGNSIMEKSLMDLWSTTKMEIHPITVSATWNLKPKGSICSSMLKITPTTKAKSVLNCLPESEVKPHCGMEVRKDCAGTVKMPKEKKNVTKELSVETVAANIIQQLLNRDSVQMAASQILDILQGLMLRKENACCAVKNLKSINTKKQNLVQGLVRLKSTGLKEKAEVYNLEVEDCPEYIANGIIVHNCRYIIHALTGRHTESIGPERKEENKENIRRIFINRGNQSSVVYDRVTGFPSGY